MKLFTKYNRVNITATIFTFVMGSIAFYFILDYVLTRQLNETLRSEQQEITDFASVHHQLPEIQNTKHQWINIQQTDTLISKPIYAIAYINRHRKKEKIRQLIFSLQVNEKSYRITVNKSETETRDLLQLIVLVNIIMIALILLFNYFINRKLINRLLKPFYFTISSMKDYHISNRKPLDLPTESIEELNLLNESLNSMTQRIFQDYTALKSFTENASHEMQTPLAVIRSKLDILIQQPGLNEIGLQHIATIEDSARRLSKLQQSLLLLTKIENRQFTLSEFVNIKPIILDRISEKEEMINSRKLQIKVYITDTVLPFHQHLAEILFNNLLNNCIRYTPEGGMMIIEQEQQIIRFINDAEKGPLNNNKIFQRFYKASDNREGTGLGLAIIKEICNLAGFIITYHFTANQHIFQINFQNQINQ